MGDIERIETDPRRSRAVVYNGMVFIGGQTCDDRTQDIKGQTRQTLAKIERFLASAQSDKSRLISAQIWMADIERDVAGMNEVWDSWTAPDSAPTRATAQVKFASRDLLVEIMVTAAVGGSAV
jgi:enamine deaminase RidA (YjgF/YER057c/UK114 family)